MSWFKKGVDKIIKTEEQIAAEQAAKLLAKQEAEKEHIEQMEHKASTIMDKLSPYLNTYCLDNDTNIYSFNNVIYHKETGRIHYNATFSTTKPGYTTFWSSEHMSVEGVLSMLRKDRERFVQLRNQYKHFGLELIKTSDKKSSQRNNAIDDILDGN
jgi:hypothetical protein